MKKQKVDKNYVSEVDLRLAELSKNLPKSNSQQAEIKKYERIYRLRDNPAASHEEDDSTLWD